MDLVIPLAHVGHYIWVLYIPPVLVVLFAIARTTISERRAAREERDQRGTGGRGA